MRKGLSQNKRSEPRCRHCEPLLGGVAIQSRAHRALAVVRMHGFGVSIATPQERLAMTATLFGAFILAEALRRVLRLYPLALVALVWELSARLGLVRPLFLPPLSAVLASLPGLLRDGDLAGPLLVSLYRAAIGLLIAMAAGLAIGFAMARIRLVRWMLGPLVAFGAPAPKIAFLPVFMLWFGIGHVSKILLVASTAVFPFIFAAQAGAETVPRQQVWAARAMGSTRLQMAWRIILPASLPSLVAGIRVAVPYAMITAFTAEMIAGGGGLGSALVMAQRYFDTATVYADLLVMLAVGYLLDVALLAAKRRWLDWDG